MTSISTPTPMNDTMRGTVPVPDRSTSSSLTTTAPSSAAPTIHGARIARRAESHIRTSAMAVHSSVMPLCTGSEWRHASKRNGTPP